MTLATLPAKPASAALVEARRLYDAGLPLLPNDTIEKYPAGHTGWNTQTFTWSEIASHLRRGGALGLRMGDDDREAVDVDVKYWLGDDQDELRRRYEELVADHAPDLLGRLVIARTRSGGRHYVYRCPDAIEGNRKLAQRPATNAEREGDPNVEKITLIETRGRGGQIMIAPSDGYSVLRGDLAAIPTITPDERAVLITCARMLHQIPESSQIDTRAARAPRIAGIATPGDVYNANGGADEALKLLEADGWVIVRQRGDTLYLRRPGKTHGVSATFGHVAPGVFHCFTANGGAFEMDHGYSPFAVRALLRHGGDYTACARLIAEEHGLPYYPAGEPLDRDGILCCPTHQIPLRASNTEGWFYCPHPDKTSESGYCDYGARVPGYTVPSTSLAKSGQSEPIAPGSGPVSTRIRAALTAAGYTFRLNEMDMWVEVNGERLTDELEAEIIMVARDADVRPIDAVRPFIIAEAGRNRYHPIRDYLTGLVWDGGAHIDALCHHLTSSDPLIEYPGDAPLPLHHVYLYRWLIGAVAKVFEQAQNLALVLAGPQDIGKSTLARWLCSGLGDAYFLEMPIDPHDKDNDLRSMRTFIWEIAELDATTRKADMSALKAFITRQVATVRKSYGRYDTTRPTIANFIGTVNKGEGFLSDPTGNRRFLVATLTAIDHCYTSAVDVNQVWAQAVALYRQGEPWRLQANERQAQEDANAEHEFDTPLEGWLTSCFERDAGDGHTMTSAEIIDHLRRQYDIRLSGSERAQAMEISRVCQRLGIERRRMARGAPFVYLGLRGRYPSETQ